MQLIVLGMHRSGTSMVARLLNMMGAYFAPEGAGLTPTADNPKGYWERNDIVQLNEGILACIGSTWQRISEFDLTQVSADLQAEFDKQARPILFGLDAHRPWMAKDPRFCLLLPLWRRLLEVPVCIYVYRCPIQVAQSLKARDGLSLQFSIALWEHYNLLALSHTQDLPKLLVNFHDLLTQPRATVSTLYQQLQLCEVQGLRLPSDKEIQAFIEPELFRQKNSLELQHSFINRQQAQLVEAFEQGHIFEWGQIPPLSAGAEAILKEHEALYWEREQQRQQREAFQNQLSQQQTEYQQALEQQQQQHQHALQQQQAQHQAVLEQQNNAHQQALAELHTQLQQQLEQQQHQLQVKEEQRVHYWQAWLAAQEREEHYQQELELLKTVRNQIQAELDSQQQTLSQLSVETQQQFRDIHKLIHWLEMLNHDLTAVFNSQTWRSGDLITRIVLKLMLRAPGLTARDHIKKIMDEFFYWRIHNRATPQHSEPKQDYLPAVIEAKKKIRIAALVALHHGEPSASASIRLILPLQHPSIQQQVHLEVYTAFDYLFYVAADIIVIQRHMVADAAAAQRLIDHCQQQHIKLVYETDDDLYNIFKKRDIYGSYPKNMLDGLNLITQHADSVITSSEPLRAQISQLNPQVVCVPNALDEQLWLEQRQGQFIQPQPQTFDNKIRILYMGTKTHSADLQLIKPAYQKIQKTYGDQVVLEIIGGFSDDNAVFAEVIQPEYLTAAETPDEYTRFVHWFRQHNRWQIGIIPLKDNAFNQKKTYIKFLDYSALGLASICSDVAPYRDIVRHEDNGLLVKNETEAWYHALKRLIEDAELRQQLAQQAFSDLTQHYILQHTAARFLQAYRHVLAQPQVTESAALELSAIEASHRDYARWISAYDTLDKKTRQQMVQRIQSWSQPPLISILMPTYNIAEPWLRAALDSVRQQIYPHWQLCIVDDASTEAHVRPLLERYAQQEPRIKLHFRQQNGHISAASNDALKLAEGQYIALLDHDDLLAPQALYWVAEEILAHPEVKLIYSDEDKIDAQGRRSGAYFKSDWNPDLFLSHNLITHLAVYHTDLLKTIDGFREGYEGAQDYDLALRAIEQIDAQQIRHIPRVLYHWRTIETSMAGNPLAKPYAIQAAQQAIQEHFRRQSISAQVAESANMSGMLRVRYPLPAAPPQVTLIIPTYNQLNLLRRCVDSLLKKTDYPHFDIVIVDNRSDEPATLAYLQQLATHAPIQILPYPHPFNFAALNNEAVKHARGEIIGFLNNDLEVINADWLSEMVSHALRPEIGVVGARLWYPHQRLQHGGIVLGIGGVAEHAHKNLLWGQSGYFGRAQVIQNFSAVTAACMLMRKQVFQAVGGFDSEHLSIAFNDVDLCLKCIQQGLRVLWTPYADLYHHESASRGYEDSPAKRARLEQESATIQQRWPQWLAYDPAYNPNLNQHQGDFTLAWPPRVAGVKKKSLKPH